MSTPFETQLLKWSARAAQSESDFLRMCLVIGARSLALNLGLYHPTDDIDIQEMEAFRFRGAELPAELDIERQRFWVNPTGRIPTDEDLDLLEARRKLTAKKK
ncbi:MAG: hypothetical protein WEC16_01455 [Anaerolineales bacterium]